jgi:hypothetical protein
MNRRGTGELRNMPDKPPRSSDMVERVARAICEDCGYDPDGPVGEDRAEWQMWEKHAQKPEAGQ